jgi:hypothetical protein
VCFSFVCGEESCCGTITSMMLFGEVLVMFWGIVLLRRLFVCLFRACALGKVVHLREYVKLGGVQHVCVLLLSWREDISSDKT